jgi:ribonuclease-3
MTDRRQAAVVALETAVGHIFADRQLLERALTHPSVGEGGKIVAHYERLEFLGDRVLNLCAAEALLALYPAAPEGELSPRLAALVNGRTCARVARRLGLGEALRLSAGESKTGGRDKDTILGDACEALMAAIYVDAGFEAARGFFDRAWADEFAAAGEARVREPKTELQEWAQGRGLPLPAYEILTRTGPDHAPVFTVQVRIEGFEPERGQGRSRQDAEKAAALAMIVKREVGQ